MLAHCPDRRVVGLESKVLEAAMSHAWHSSSIVCPVEEGVAWYL